jgi:hypothetical protein
MVEYDREALCHFYSKSEVRMRQKSNRKTSVPKPQKAPWPPSQSRLRGLVKDALVDAYTESEQRMGFFTMIEEHLTLPFETNVLGVVVTVEQIDLTETGEVVAICRRGRDLQSIPILDLRLPKPIPDGAEWIEAYRYWARGS